MDAHPLVVLGASEGGVHAVRDLLGALDSDFSAPILIVVHIGAHRSVLPALFNQRSALPSSHPFDGETALPGHIYVAPPDYHMIVDDGLIRLTKGPRENFARPSIDPLFRSAAEAYGTAVIGVILTGGLNDGTAGLFEVKRRGGTTVVQEPADAVNPSMPRSALAHVEVDHCVPLALMPSLLRTLVATRISAPPLSSQDTSEGLDMDSAQFTLDKPVAVTCPDCGGALRETRCGTLRQFRCHIGHVYTDEVLLSGQFEAMEHSIEAAMRSLNERAELCRQMAGRSDGADLQPGPWADAMNEALERAKTLRGLLEADWVHPFAEPAKTPSA